MMLGCWHVKWDAYGKWTILLMWILGVSQETWVPTLTSPHISLRPTENHTFRKLNFLNSKRMIAVKVWWDNTKTIYRNKKLAHNRYSINVSWLWTETYAFRAPSCAYFSARLTFHTSNLVCRIKPSLSDHSSLSGLKPMHWFSSDTTLFPHCDK